MIEVNQSVINYNNNQQSNTEKIDLESRVAELPLQSKLTSIGYIQADLCFGHSIKLINRNVKLSKKSKNLFSPSLKLSVDAISQTLYPPIETPIITSQMRFEQEKESFQKNIREKNEIFSKKRKKEFDKSKEECLLQKYLGNSKIIDEQQQEEDQGKNSIASRRSISPRRRISSIQGRFSKNYSNLEINESQEQNDIRMLNNSIQLKKNEKLSPHYPIEIQELSTITVNTPRKAFLAIIKEPRRLILELKSLKLFYEPIQLISDNLKKVKNNFHLIKKIDTSSILSIIHKEEKNMWIRLKQIHIPTGGCNQKLPTKKHNKCFFSNLEEIGEFLSSLESEDILKQKDFKSILHLSSTSNQIKLPEIENTISYTSQFITQSIQGASIIQASPKTISVAEKQNESEEQKQSLGKEIEKQSFSNKINNKTNWNFYDNQLQKIRCFRELDEDPECLIIASTQPLEDIYVCDVGLEQNNPQKVSEDHIPFLHQNYGPQNTINNISPKSRQIYLPQIQACSVELQNQYLESQSQNSSKINQSFQGQTNSILPISPTSMSKQQQKSKILFDFSLSGTEDIYSGFNSPSKKKNMILSKQSGSPPFTGDNFIYSHISKHNYRIKGEQNDFRLINICKEIGEVIKNSPLSATIQKNKEANTFLNDFSIKQDCPRTEEERGRDFDENKITYKFRPKWVKARRNQSLRTSVAMEINNSQRQSLAPSNINQLLFSPQKAKQNSSSIQSHDQEEVKQSKLKKERKIIPPGQHFLLNDQRYAEQIIQQFLKWIGLSSFRQISELLFKDAFYNLQREELETIFAQFIMISNAAMNYLENPIQSLLPSFQLSSIKQSAELILSSKIWVKLTSLKECYPIINKLKELGILKQAIKYILSNSSSFVDGCFQSGKESQIHFFWQDFLKFKAYFILQKWQKNEKLEFILQVMNPGDLPTIPFRVLNQLFPDGLRFPDPFKLKLMKDFLSNPIFIQDNRISALRVADCLQKETFLSLNDIIKYLTQS